MHPGGEIAAPERYRCGTRQAAKRPGLAEEAHGESTKWRKTDGKKPPCLNTLHDGAANEPGWKRCDVATIGLPSESSGQRFLKISTSRPSAIPIVVPFKVWAIAVKAIPRFIFHVLLPKIADELLFEAI
jgi:hypothetical protein